MNTNIDLGENKISQQYNTKKAIKSILFVVLGLLSIVITVLLSPEKDSPIYLLLLTVGLAIALFGVLKLLFSDKEYIYTPTKSPVKAHSISFDGHKLATILTALDREEYAILEKVRKDINTGAQLDILYSEDNQLFVYQTFKYIPYRLEPASELYQVEESRRTAFSDYINRSNK